MLSVNYLDVVKIVKKSSIEKPLISIVIAVYNGVDTIQHCIDSIVNQTYQFKELIIIDGGSTDGTVELLENNDNNISKWLSETDSGIYNAWNKAFKYVQGDYICFLGADDYWADNQSLANLISSLNGNVYDIVSSKVAFVDTFGNKIRVAGEKWNWCKMKKYMCVAHPGMLHHVSLFELHGTFNERYSIASDYEFLLRLGSSLKFSFYDYITVKMGMAGISNTNIKLALKETLNIQSCHPNIGSLKAYINYYIAVIKIKIKIFFGLF